MALTTRTAKGSKLTIAEMDANLNYLQTLATPPVTNRFYVDPARQDTYTQNGQDSTPYKTIGAALTAIDAAITAGNLTAGDTNPIFVILRGNSSETVTLTRGHVYLVGDNGGIHTPIYLAGTVSITPTAGDLGSNHFAITGLHIVGPTNGNALQCTGTLPCRVFLQDVWITANGTGAGYLQTNTGTGTICNGDSVKFSHNGSGDVYCVDITKGSANFTAAETSGAVQVGAVRAGATLAFSQSELVAAGDIVLETYGTGSLTVTLSTITNTAANSNGFKLNDAGGVLTLGNNLITVPAGTGKVVNGVAGTFLFHAGNIFGGANTAKTGVSATQLSGTWS